jgi:hypothetical protein
MMESHTRWMICLVTLLAAAGAIGWTSETETKGRFTASPIEFSDARTQAVEFIGYYRSIALTPDQARVRDSALSTIPAPCCEEFSLATCCCPCNLAKSAWGLAHLLIARYGSTVEEVNAAALRWLKFINEDGFSGDACFTGGCRRPFKDNGCGGMDDGHVEA